MTRVAILGGGVAGLRPRTSSPSADSRSSSSSRATSPAARRATSRPRLGHRRPRRPAGRARLPVLPRLLPAPAGHDAAHPGRPGHGRSTTSPARRASCSRRPAAATSYRRRAPARVARGPRRPQPLLFQVMTSLGVPPEEHAWLMDRILTLLTSCDDRRYEQWELQSWWVFVRAEQRSDGVQEVPRRRPHAHAGRRPRREISARTGGLILAQLLFDLTRAGGRADRVLDAPTNEAWIDPWSPTCPPAASTCAWRARCEGVRVRDGRIAGVDHAGRHGDRRPLRRRAARRGHAPLAGPPLRALEPRLAALDRLVTRWMNGVLFYLDRDVPLVHGHAIYIDSEWALTSISQAQFWRDRPERFGDGRVGGSCRSTSPTGRRPAGGPASPRRAARATRSAPRSGASSPTTSTTVRSRCSTSATC